MPWLGLFGPPSKVVMPSLRSRAALFRFYLHSLLR